MFYANKYLNWNQFNQLYNLNWVEKTIKIIDIFAYKLKLTLIGAINDRLKVVKEKMQKKKKW